MFGLREWRRRRLAAQRLPAGWLEIVERNVPCYRRLSEQDQIQLGGLIQIFLAEKRFEGCGGLELTDEIRVTIAAQACILLLGRQNSFYPTVRTVLVYPHAYIAHTVRRQPDGTVVEGKQVRLGESWMHGAVVLAWDVVVRDISDVHDGRNIVLHEFAHQLDNESGAAEGAPALPRRSMFVAWARVLGREYESLIDSIEQQRPTVLDEYGATSPAEFFAVATECFFEKSVLLRQKHPELYEQLSLFYGRDPAALPGG